MMTLKVSGVAASLLLMLGCAGKTDEQSQSQQRPTEHHAQDVNHRAVVAGDPSEGLCLCGDTCDAAVNTSALALSDERLTDDQIFDLTLNFADPVADITLYDLVVDVGGTLRTPVAIDGPCGGLQREDNVRILDVRLAAGESRDENATYELTTDAQGTTAIKVRIMTGSVRNVLATIEQAYVGAGLVANEPSAVVDEANRHVVMSGSLPLDALMFETFEGTMDMRPPTEAETDAEGVK